MANHPHTHSKTQDSMYDAEHWVGLVMAFLALLLMAVGLLRGFGVLGAEGAAVVPSDLVGDADEPHWLLGSIWLLAAFSAGFLSMALHKADHHLLRDPELLDDKDEALWKSEHFTAWAMALATIIFAAIGLLVGLDEFGRGTVAQEGILWLLASNIMSILTNTLHSVRHHQVAGEEDYIVHMVEERATITAPTATTTRPVTEHDRGSLG
jgi:hypothetical protein